MATLELPPETFTQAAELAKGFGWRSTQATIARIVATFYQAYTDSTLPLGWQLNADLTHVHMERYFDAYEAEGGGNAWHERGRALRAAVKAGWFVMPEGVTIEAIDGLKPRESIRLKNAVDAHYTRLTTADPNSSGPLPST